MASQKEIIQTLDALLVLGGEGKDHSRTNHTSDLHQSVIRNAPLYLILSGSHSGLYEEVPEETEAEEMKYRLLAKGIPEEIIETENEARDTIGNMVYSRPLIDQILSDSHTKKVGIVTDKFHMKRSLWTAQRVFPTTYIIEPLPTEKGTTIIGHLRERAIEQAHRIDFCGAGLSPGNQKAWEEYMRTKHPMHNKDAPFGAYKAGIELLKRLG